MTDTAASRTHRPTATGLTTLRGLGLAVGIAAFILVLLVEIPGLEPAGQRMLAILVLAVALWVSEAIPLFATAALVILLEVLLLSDQTLLPLADGPPLPSAATYFGALASPVIILFLGGFLIADAAHKYRLDRNLAAWLLQGFAGNARLTLLGLMLITALLSMFMSNTATTATMFAVALPIIASFPPSPTRTGFALAIPVAANLGGLGTPIGSPPNAIALGALHAQGQGISFLGWMILAVPLMLVLLAFAWWFLTRRYIAADARATLALRGDLDRSPAALIFYAVALLTLVLWLSEPLHGLPSPTVAWIPVVLLFATGVMTGSDLRSLQWPVLWLVAGGIALGYGIGSSGLDRWFVGLVAWEHLPLQLLLLFLVGIAIALSTLISNSATANLLVPLALGLAVVLPIDLTAVGVMVALACSLAMALPISTPPNAIAYATGEVSATAMASTGLVIGVVGGLLLALALPGIWASLGLL